MSLKKELEKFIKSDARESLLRKDYTVFTPIAQAILNGYFEVSKGNTPVKFIRPTKVEFYYHEEYAIPDDSKKAIQGKVYATFEDICKEAVDNELTRLYNDAPIDENLLIKDFIVYHRNTGKNTHIPLFNIGTLNNHQSGIDITFEHETKVNDKEVYVRASALIRGFYVYTDREECEAGYPIPSKYKSSVNLRYPEDRCTYLYDQLYGDSSIFEDGFTVKWIDCDGDIKPLSAPRINVSQYQVNDNNTSVKKAPEKIQTTKNIKYIPDNRELQFYNRDFYL